MFQPHPLLKNPHLQTLYAPLLRKQKAPTVEIETFELEDGDFVECYWHLQRPKDTRPIVILFHGLAGSFHSPYIQGLMRTLHAQKMASVVMHFRGCSGKPNRLPRSYHSGDTADAKAWIYYLHEHYPNNPLYAVGYSIGGNMLLKLLGEEQEQIPLNFAIAISAPMDLKIAADTLQHGFAKLYQAHLLKPLKAMLLNKYQMFDMKSILKREEEEIKKIKTVKEFDDFYTAPIHGFKSALDYYEQSSSKPFLGKITTQTKIIHAIDDPFMTPEVLPNQGEYSSWVQLEVYPHGGHVGFVQGGTLKPKYWLEHRITTILATHEAYR